MPDEPPDAKRQNCGLRDVHVHILGHGSVSQAVLCRLKAAHANGTLSPIERVYVYAPEIEGDRSEGIFSFHHIPVVERETLVQVVDSLKARPGDILVELATRIDTVSIWQQAKAKGLHFLNTAFDVWGDLELDLTLLDNIRREPLYKRGSGLTSIFSMGMNPGIVSHFVSQGLKLATGVENPREAAKAFGLRAVIFTERDNQWPHAGSKEEKLLLDDQQRVLYNTWSPGNFVVETAECKLLWATSPKEAEQFYAHGPTFVSWVPNGPIVGFAPPHDETFTTQVWFDREIPSMFIYEAPPSARFHLKGEHLKPSSDVVAKLLTPGGFNVRDDCYDMIGALLLSDKPDQVPYWCGLNMTVAEAARQDDTRYNGPTPLEVMGGVWTALRYILEHPQVGDCFPEDLPTDYVIKTAFPWAGHFIARSCPEALQVPGYFDPSAPNVMERVLSGQVDLARLEIRASAIHGNGTFAAVDILAGTVLAQLPLDGSVLVAPAFTFNHSCEPNAYVDRNRAVRTIGVVKRGQEITVDYALSATRSEASSAAVASCNCGSGHCRKSASDWTKLPVAKLNDYLRTIPILRELEEEIAVAQHAS